MNSRDIIKAELFKVAYVHSYGKAGLYGEIVAWCLANRVRRNMGNWLEVIANVSKYQASEPDSTPYPPNVWEPNVVKLLHAIDDIYDNAGLDQSNGGLYWCFTENGANEWFRENVIANDDLSVTATQNSLRVWGPKKTIGAPYDPRFTHQGRW